MSQFRRELAALLGVDVDVVSSRALLLRDSDVLEEAIGPMSVRPVGKNVADLLEAVGAANELVGRGRDADDNDRLLRGSDVLPASLRPMAA